MAHLEDIDALKWVREMGKFRILPSLNFVIIAFILPHCEILNPWRKKTGYHRLGTHVIGKKAPGPDIDELKKALVPRTVRLNNAPPVAGPPGLATFFVRITS